MINELKELGLNEKEINIYLKLLAEKTSTASKLAKLTKINRTTVYLELDNLMQLGLVNYVIINSKRHYQAASPDKLIDILNFKRERILSILPKLKVLNTYNVPFKTEVYEGKEGIKTFYQDVLKTNKDFLVLGATGKAMNVMRYYYPQILNKLKKTKIKERALANYTSKKIMDKHPKSHINIKYLPKKFYFPVTTVVYSNKVAIQSLQNENIYVIIITDENLAKSYNNFFEYIWETID
jgi:sugar-specific transcriptional regulator TrmB